MATRQSAVGVDLWRFIAGIGIGVELVTIDTYVANWCPRTHRGRAFAYNQFFQFLAVPIVAFSGLAAGAASRRWASTAGAGWC